MDVTSQFLAAAKGEDVSNGGPIGDSGSHGGSRSPGLFMQRANEVLRNLAKMKRFVDRTAPSYVRVRVLLTSESPPMNDQERDNVDHQLALFISDCSKSLDRLKALAAKAEASGYERSSTKTDHGEGDDCREDGTAAGHRSGVVLALLDMLQSLSSQVSQMQAVRYQCTLEARAPFASPVWSRAAGSRGKQSTGLSAIMTAASTPAPSKAMLERMILLTPEELREQDVLRNTVPALFTSLWSAARSSSALDAAAGVPGSGSASGPQTGSGLIKGEDGDGSDHDSSSVHAHRTKNAKDSGAQGEMKTAAFTARKIVHPIGAQNGEDRRVLGEQEVRQENLQRYQQQQQQLEQENGLLVASLEGELDDVRKVETSMRELAELMNLFTVKVSQQTDSVQSIADSTTFASDQVDKGFEELKKTASRSRGMRHLYVTFALVLSAVLLMLDQYFP